MKLGALNLQQILLKVRRGFDPIVRHHVIIAFVFVVGILIAAIIAVNAILTQPADQAYIAEKQTEAVKTRFDETTIKQIDALRRSDDSTSLDAPNGARINPFIEGAAAYDFQL